MKRRYSPILLLCLLSLAMIISACSTFAPPAATSTSTPEPTATQTASPTATFTPTRTPRPTATPNLAATEKYEAYQAEAQSYFEAGYLTTVDGRIEEIDEFKDDWAQLGWYRWLPLGTEVSDFFISAHFKWESAYKNASESGCGFTFAVQPDYGHYAVFLDRSKIIFLDADSSYGSYVLPVGITRGPGRVKYGNPAEADFALIVKGISAYVLVDNEFIGEYTLSKSRILTGDIGLTILSGTNKDYGTRCEMTNIRLFAPK